MCKSLRLVLKKIRFTGLVAASASGRRLMPALIVKGPSVDIHPLSNHVQLVNKVSWMNGELFKRWIEYAFPVLFSSKKLLVFDSARSHLSRIVKDYLHSRGILFCVIPGGLTGLLQPADVMWFKPLKSHLRDQIRQWIREGPWERTRGGRIRPPSASQLAGCFADAWGSIGSADIVKSFEVTFLGPLTGLLISRSPEYGTDFTRLVEEIEPIQEELSGDSEVCEIDE